MKLLFGLVIGIRLIQAQGTFDNLDLRLAVVSDLPPGVSGGIVDIRFGMPNWTAASQDGEVGFVFHNDLSAGASQPSILARTEL